MLDLGRTSDTLTQRYCPPQSLTISLNRSPRRFLYSFCNECFSLCPTTFNVFISWLFSSPLSKCSTLIESALGCHGDREVASVGTRTKNVTEVRIGASSFLVIHCASSRLIRLYFCPSRYVYPLFFAQSVFIIDVLLVQLCFVLPLQSHQFLGIIGSLLLQLCQIRLCQSLNLCGAVVGMTMQTLDDVVDVV